ncbi:MAG: molybdenum ABC transporter ATP-binding protein [Gammaproteobacteria bacterium]
MSIEARFRCEREGFTLDVELTLPGRGITSLFGPSGCGKTTLLRAIAGLEPGIRGRLTVGGKRWQDETTFLPPHKRPVGYVFQQPGLFPHLDVRGNLEYGLKRLPAGRRRVPLEDAVDLLGIGHLLQRHPAQLSGGEQQRVAIARALAVSPGILLMDEPLSALDEARKQEILPWLESLRDELDIPVIHVSHSRDEVARLADHLVLLDAGRVSASGPVREMLTRLDLPLAHGGDAEALIEATVAGHDEEYGLTWLDFPGGRVSVIHKALAPGSRVRLRLLARDVSLTLEPQSGTSILNIFPARVEEIVSEGTAQMVVRLLVGETPILARVTRKSSDLLQLEPGKLVYAQAKSVAVLS